MTVEKALVLVLHFLAAVLTTLHVTQGQVLAQPYPSKAVRVIILFPPGGGVDIIGRVIAARLSDALSQQFVIDNRPGASGILGTGIVARSVPDGYPRHVMLNEVNNPAARPEPFDKAQDKLREAESKHDSH